MWPFKPAWMSENTDKAKKALDLIADQEKLAQIVMEAPHYGVREAALAKIESQPLLAKFAKSDGGLIGHVPPALQKKDSPYKSKSRGSVTEITAYEAKTIVDTAMVYGFDGSHNSGRFSGCLRPT